jgi:hypothetical protein
VAGRQKAVTDSCVEIYDAEWRHEQVESHWGDRLTRNPGHLPDRRRSATDQAERVVA